MAEYVYIRSEKPGWFPSPKQDNSVYLRGSFLHRVHKIPLSIWMPESDHDTKENAAARVHWLNGGKEINNG